MFEPRPEERPYAWLQDAPHPEVNRYGTPIRLVSDDDPLAGQSMRINGDQSVGENPNRYKQHGFYFNADNCIACHAASQA